MLQKVSVLYYVQSLCPVPVPMDLHAPLLIRLLIAQRKVQLLARARVVRFVENDVIAAIELRRLNRISFLRRADRSSRAISGRGVTFSVRIFNTGRRSAGSASKVSS